jgi:hypothetical protein
MQYKLKYIDGHPYSTVMPLPGLQIRIHLIRIRIKHFKLNTDPDPGF